MKSEIGLFAGEFFTMCGKYKLEFFKDDKCIVVNSLNAGNNIIKFIKAENSSLYEGAIRCDFIVNTSEIYESVDNDNCLCTSDLIKEFIQLIYKYKIKIVLSYDYEITNKQYLDFATYDNYFKEDTSLLTIEFDGDEGIIKLNTCI